MSDRFEWIAADACPAQAFLGDTRLGENTVDDDIALALGRSESTALVIEGSREEIIALLDEARRALDQPYWRVPEHNNDLGDWCPFSDSLVTDDPTTGCPQGCRASIQED